MTVMLASESVGLAPPGRPPSSAQMWSPRCASPDVATANGRPSARACTTATIRRSSVGSVTATRHGRPFSARPTIWMSPPTPKEASVNPASVRIPTARSTAHPFT